MPETTRADFLGHLEASHLLTDEQLATVREAPIDASAMVLADKLLSDGLLTGWQAPMLLYGYDKFFLGKYKLLDHIGQGGMGSVLKAEHAAMGRVVAIKVMAEKLVQNTGALARFRREIQAAAALNHPNIVTVYDADEANGMHFLVMEYVDGEDLGVVVRRQGRLPLGEVCEYMRQAAAGLQHAHERGMVHRDIKPSNFLLMQRDDGTRVVKILDMGLARFTRVKSDSDGMTQTGQIMGTPNYISPEQARSTRSADIRSDIYSLGCSLFRLLIGRVPFEGENAMEKLMARSLSDAPRMSQLLTGIPPELDAVVAKMLARDPNARYQTPAEVASALTPFAKLTGDETLLELSASGGRQPPVIVAEPAQESAGLRPPLAPPQITKAGAKLKQQIGQRKRTEKKRLVMI
ncbi:MAG: serine/threonine-protein kinase, partial [Planctomycetaceae bacterium]